MHLAQVAVAAGTRDVQEAQLMRMHQSSVFKETNHSIETSKCGAELVHSGLL